MTELFEGFFGICRKLTRDRMWSLKKQRRHELSVKRQRTEVSLKLGAFEQKSMQLCLMPFLDE